jgi:spermidine synthase
MLRHVRSRLVALYRGVMSDDPRLRTDRITASLVSGRGDNGGYSLVVDGTTQSHVNPDDPLDLQLEYVRVIAAIIEGSRPAGKPVSVLHLGGGALSLPRYLAVTRPGSRQHVVELYEELYGFVVEHLPLPDDTITAEFRDAREALEDAGRYEMAIVDVFSGDVAPRHISTVQFFETLAGHLEGGGLVIVNTLATRGLEFTRDAVATLREVFEHVAAVTRPDVASGGRIGNVELVASDAILDVDGIRAKLAGQPRTIEVISGAELDDIVSGATARRD